MHALHCVAEYYAYKNAYMGRSLLLIIVKFSGHFVLPGPSYIITIYTNWVLFTQKEGTYMREYQQQ